MTAFAKGFKFRWEPQDIAPVASLLALVLFFGIAAPGFLRLSTLVTALQQGAVLAIVSTGLTFVLLAAEIDLAVGSMALWTACLCGWLYQSWATQTAEGRFVASAEIVIAVLILPLCTSLLLGILSGVLTVKSRLPSFIITLAMMFISQGAARYITRGQAFRVPALLGDIGNRGIEHEGLTVIPYSALLAAAIMTVGHVVLQYTRFGRYVYMTGGNRQAARLAGVPTGLVVTACLAISAVTAGIGGLVNAGRMTSVTLDQNQDLLLSALACIVLGGTSLFGGEGGIGKTLVGVATFTVLNIGLNSIRLDDFARPFVMGVVLMAAFLLNAALARRQP
ncbi:ABC transporter permease [Thermogutta sp.]|uniref:ABC transporter permease n=1 Tax=Thermogutta sp. TaxID=1962930 RepID=UPI0032208034